MGKLKRELSKELELLKEAYEQLAQNFDEMNAELLAFKEEIAEVKRHKIVYIKDATGIHCNFYFPVKKEVEENIQFLKENISEL